MSTTVLQFVQFLLVAPAVALIQSYLNVAISYRMHPRAQVSLLKE
jgi:hypothetical protein